MKKTQIRQAIRIGSIAVLVSSSVLLAQAPAWSVTGADIGQSGWQKSETILSRETAAASFQFLWKIDLGKMPSSGESFSEPLLSTRLINSRGFKDIVFTSSADTLYAVDSELGTLVWKKQFASPSRADGCLNSALGLLIEPPPVINFQARRTPASATPAPPPPSPTAPRRIGGPAAGGYFAFKGIYVLPADGMLHELVQTTGADYAPPVKFLPSSNENPSGLNIRGKAIYAVTGPGCSKAPSGVVAIDMTTADYPVATFSHEAIPYLSVTGPAIAPDGTAYVVTGAAKTELGGSIVALGPDMKVKDWYTPTHPLGRTRFASPITFPYKGRQLVVAPGSDGTIVLLDAESLGGADHHTPLAESAVPTTPGELHLWDSFGAWTDKSGTAWVYASVAAPFGKNPHGGIIAYKLADADGKLSLVQAWASPDMINPAPPSIANGVVIALAGGNQSAHARLSVIDAATGAELYSSKEVIPTYTSLSGVSIGDGHVFFTDHNGVLYSFGIGMEH